MQTLAILSDHVAPAIARYIISFIAPAGALAICDAKETKKRFGQSMYELCAESGFVEPAISPEATRWNPMWVSIAAARGGHIEIIAHHMRGERRGRIPFTLTVAARNGNVGLVRDILALIRGPGRGAVLMTALRNAMPADLEDVMPRHVKTVSILVAEYRSQYPAMVRLPMYGYAHAGIRAALSGLWIA